MNKIPLIILQVTLSSLAISCGATSSNPANDEDIIVAESVVSLATTTSVETAELTDTVEPNQTLEPSGTVEPTETIEIAAVDSYFNETRFTLSAQACIEGLSDLALSVEDGFKITTLVSDELSCIQRADGDSIIYSVLWNGNDFNRDDINDTLTFDLRVEGFSNSVFSYDELDGQSSMTSLGNPSPFNYLVNDENATVSFWDIEGDLGEGITQGQSLRFSVENISVSLNNYNVTFSGFNTINVIETKAGHSHSHIRGQGTGLNSGITNDAEQFSFDPFNTFVITGAGDSSSTNIWGISDIQFSFTIDNPDLVSVNSSEWLAGSWGITYPVFGGERLDDEVDNNNYDYKSGAQEIVDELPAVGHIITNLSYFAHSYYFTLRQNDNVDIANEIHESMVPTLENEKLILDVLQTFKDADKRIILYVSTNYFVRASEEAQAAWKVYYTTKFNGDEYLAYENLMQGFIERFKDYADGYWLDTTTLLDEDGKLQDFIHMIKQTDPTAIVSANRDKNYFNVDGVNLLVDSDGVDDIDETDYRIVLHEPLNPFQDFSNGHVTPISSGAPVNSWAYEEYTLPNMINEPLINAYGKTTLKHAWFPVRVLWHSPNQPLVFGVEQAYRFVKNVTDGNAAVTFATTTSDKNTTTPGYLMADEMLIMKEINSRLLMENPPTPQVYIRPEGASLVISD